MCISDGAGSEENLCVKGAYVLSEPDGGRDVTLISTGAEVGFAVAAAKTLADSGVRAAVVSMPCMELFRAQSEAYRTQVLGKAPRIAIEAGVAQCWYEWLREEDEFVGLSDFGASAPAGKLFPHFGLTPEAVVATAKRLLGK